MLNKIRELISIYRTKNILRSLSVKELDDIGLSYWDIDHYGKRKSMEKGVSDRIN